MSAQPCCALIIIHIETQNKDDCCESIGDFLGKFYVFTQSLTLQAPSPQNDKHIRTIRQQLPANSLNMFDHFVGLMLEGVVSPLNKRSQELRKSLIIISTG